MVNGTVGYMLFGMSFNDAAYQTVTTVTTVGFRELEDFDAARQWFTIALIIMGASTVLFTFTIAMQFVHDGQLRHVLGALHAP